MHSKESEVLRKKRSHFNIRAFRSSSVRNPLWPSTSKSDCINMDLLQQRTEKFKQHKGKHKVANTSKYTTTDVKKTNNQESRQQHITWATCKTESAHQSMLHYQRSPPLIAQCCKSRPGDEWLLSRDKHGERRSQCSKADKKEKRVNVADETQDRSQQLRAILPCQATDRIKTN